MHGGLVKIQTKIKAGPGSSTCEVCKRLGGKP